MTLIIKFLNNNVNANKDTINQMESFYVKVNITTIIIKILYYIIYVKNVLENVNYVNNL